MRNNIKNKRIYSKPLLERMEVDSEISMSAGKSDRINPNSVSTIKLSNASQENSSSGYEIVSKEEALGGSTFKLP